LEPAEEVVTRTTPRSVLKGREKRRRYENVKTKLRSTAMWSIEDISEKRAEKKKK
jgi:hypothetical protein